MAVTRVLLIDDDEDDYILMRELISLVRDGDYALEWAPSYEEGLIIAGRAEHDVCLVDHFLGERTGVQLIRAARSTRLTTPMILLTGNGDRELDLEAMEAGATDYLVKDETSPSRLERTIRYAVRLNLERRQAEQELTQSEARFRRVVESNVLGIFFLNSRGIIPEANQAFLNMIGYSREEFDATGLSWTEMTPPEFRKLDENALEELKVSGISETYEKEYLRKDGERISILVNIATLEGEKHDRVAFVLDISERRKLEEQLRQSQKLESVGMLAGGIAHDFNNLLMVITGYSELVLKRLDKLDPLGRNVEEIMKAATKATSLTRQLLAFSRKQLLQPRVLNLNLVVADIGKMLSRLIGEDIELRTSPGVELGQVKADPGQIEQVILNLAVNARDSMPTGGKITIETANVYLDKDYARQHVTVVPGWYVMLAVSDTGAGMDENTLKFIFEPFFTTKEPGRGTGLGLATVYGIVKQSGGNIWVYSELGVGTSFKIYLPLVHEEVSEPEVRMTTQDGIIATETILLAEDDEMVRKLVRDSLSARGYTVLAASSAMDALLLSKSHKDSIDVLLTDVVMPGMSGGELVSEVLKVRPDVRVLYMSGYTDGALVDHGILHTQIAFIGKPFTPDALVLKIREVLGKSVRSTSLV